MEPDCSLPHTQLSVTCPYLEPDQSSPYASHPTFWRSILLLSSYLGLKLLSGLFPSRFPTKTLYRTLPSPIRTTYITYLIILDFITRTKLGEEYRSLCSSLRSFSPLPLSSLLLGPNIILNTHFSNNLSLRSSLNVSDQVSHPYKTTVKIRVLNILIFKFFDSKLEDKRFCTEWKQAFPDFNMLLVSSWMEVWFVQFFLNIWILPPFQKNNYQFSYYNFVLHSHLETWACT